METILIVDDEKNYHLPLSTLFKHEGYQTLSAYSGNQAWTILLEQDVDLVLSDMTMPDGDGLELLSRVKAAKPEIPVVMLTAFGTVELAVGAMKQGAFDYLTKPCDNDEMLRTVAKALEVSRLGRQNRDLRLALTQRHSFGSLVGKSKPMLELYNLLEKVAPSKSTVLVTGESGTGKELVAQALHYNSNRSESPFVAVNCSALSPSLLESELFGHEKGAFTDAKSGRAGRFEMAEGGSLFLDEIGEMDPGLQVKLLRVIQERSFERVGGGRTINMDVRLIAATNRNLKQEVTAGRFREDLFYRLNVVNLVLPSLRERLDDLPLLVEHFLKLYGEESGAGFKTMSKDALKSMYTYKWPGNIRELGNVVERGVVLSSGPEISVSDLPDEIRNSAQLSTNQVAPPRQATGPRGDGFSHTGQNIKETTSEEVAECLWVNEILGILPAHITLDEAISALEEAMVRTALKARDGVQSHAAELLGLKKNVFKYKWDKYVDLEPTSLSLALTGEVPDDVGLVAALESLEEAMLLQSLEQAGRIQSQAAELLGIKKNLMQYKLKKFNIDPRNLK